MRRSAALLLVVSLLPPQLALAGSAPARLTLVPQPAQPADFVQLREDVPATSPSWRPYVEVIGPLIRITSEIPDYGGQQFPAQTLFTPVGNLPSGVYRVEYIGCGNPPPPIPRCQLLDVGQFAVGGLAATSVPGPGRIASSALAGLVALVAAVVLRRRSLHQ